MNNNSSRSFIDDQGNIRTNSFNNSQMSNRIDHGFLDPKKLISLIRRHIWLILCCFIVSVGASYYLVNYYVLPVYESSGTILVSSDRSDLPAAGGLNPSTGVGKIISNSFNTNYNDPVQSAIYLIESREVSQRVARNLIDLEKNSTDNLLLPTLWAEYPVDTSRVSVEGAGFRIQSGITVTPVGATANQPNLLKVTYQSYSAREAAKVVNLVLDAYQAKTLEQKQNSADKALTFLEQKKQEVREQLNDAEDRLVRFQNEFKLVAIDQQAGNSVNALNSLQAEKQNLKIQLESLNSSIKNFERQMETIKPGMSEDYSKALGPTIERYQKQLAELRTRRFVILSNNPQLKDNPNSEPELKKLNQQIDELEKEIQSLSKGLVNEKNGFLEVSGNGNLAQELGNIQNNLIELRIEENQIQSQIQILNQRIQKTQGFLDKYPDNQVQLARLQTEVERHKELLNTIISQISEISLWQQTQKSSGEIIDDAKPKFSPVKPRKIIWYGFAAMLGTMIPIGLILLKDSLNSLINSTEQLKSLPYPLLPVVYDHSLLKKEGWFSNKGKNKKLNHIDENLIFYHNPESPLAESYRKIVSQILYSNPDSIPHSILVTSSGKGEGKTTFTGNLALALAEVDKKVLVIDCDFRRPAVHKLFSLDNSVGINEVIFQGQKLSKAINNVGIQGVSVLTSGAKPPSPAKLLSSSKFKQMFKILKPNYDIILLDTPPQGLVSDAASLVNETDLVIVASKFGETKQNILEHTLQDLDKNRISEINLVLTHFKPSKSYDSYDTKGTHEYMYQKYYEYEKIQNNN